VITRHGLVVLAVWGCGLGACGLVGGSTPQPRMIGTERPGELVEFNLKDGTHCAALLMQAYGGAALTCNWGNQ
jgi:hypothetical protein